MSEIIASLAPGQYTGAQTLTVTFPPDARRAIVTREDRSPVLTEILAYDRGPIPPGTTIENRPFIAVTQDGRGNVTFDGGFPKFYNMHIPTFNGGAWPALPYTFDKLPYQFKYMDNCLKFCANPRKLALGNRKILLLGNTLPTESYCVKVSQRFGNDGAPENLRPGGFKDSFEAIAQAGNWDLTILSVSAAGAVIDLDFDYFDQYAAVIFLNSYPHFTTDAPFRITERTASELSVYRLSGNGVIVITDHCGDNYTSLEDALARGTIYASEANRVTKYYGAYFSGDVDRSPVSVGEIRQQLIAAGGNGQHPLFDGMADNEMIFAGGSESLTMPQLFDGDLVPENEPYVVDMSTPGVYRVNVLVQLNDGTILTKPMRFVIIDPSDINIRDGFNRTPTNGQITTFKNVIDYTIDATDIDRTMTGQILVDDSLVGYFIASKNNNVWNTVYHPLGGPNVPMPINNNQVLKFVVTDPFEYAVSATVNIPDPNPYWQSSTTLAAWVKKIVSHPYYVGKTIDVVTEDLAKYSDKCYPMATSLGSYVKGQWWAPIGKGRLAFAQDKVKFYPIKVKVYDTEATWQSTNPSVGNIGDAVLIASTNAVFYWDDRPMVWSKHPKTANDIFGLGRSVINTIDNTNWVIQRFTTVPV